MNSGIEQFIFNLEEGTSLVILGIVYPNPSVLTYKMKTSYAFAVLFADHSSSRHHDRGILLIWVKCLLVLSTLFFMLTWQGLATYEGFSFIVLQESFDWAAMGSIRIMESCSLHWGSSNISVVKIFENKRAFRFAKLDIQHSFNICHVECILFILLTSLLLSNKKIFNISSYYNCIKNIT